MTVRMTVRTDAITLAPAPCSIKVGRRWATRWARENHATAAVTRVVELLTSELVTNAVVHPRTPSPITVRARKSDRRLVFSVTDTDANRPVVRSLRPGTTGGQGMRIVQALSSDWGVELHGSAGKTVWFSTPA